MMSLLEQAYDFDIQIRISDDRAAPAGAKLVTQDIGEGVVYQQDGVVVTAFLVDHAPVSPALGYRVDYAGHSVVLSGDTRVSENLIRYAERVDLLIHEVVSQEALLRTGGNPERIKARIAHHTTAQQAGDVFARTNPKLAVYSHVGPPDATTDDLIPPTRLRYSGPLEVGEDLMVIDIGETVTVHRPAPRSP